MNEAKATKEKRSFYEILCFMKSGITLSFAGKRKNSILDGNGYRLRNQLKINKVVCSESVGGFVGQTKKP